MSNHRSNGIKRNLWFGIGIVVVVALAIVLFVTQTKKEPEEIKIGVITPLTGPAAEYGTRAKWGIDLSANELNAISERKLSLLYEDSKAEPKEAVNALRKLITLDKVKVVIGAVTSSEFLAIAPIAEENKIILITPSASNPKISEAGDYIFRNCYSDIYEAQKMAEYVVNSTSYRKVAVLYINNDYGLGLENAFKSFFEKLGGEVISEESYEPQEKDFKTHILKIRNTDSQALYLVGFTEMGYVLKQAKEIGFHLPVFSCIMFEDPAIVKIAKEAGDGVIYAYPSYSPESEEQIIKGFVENFKEKYGELPNIYAATAYDALKILYTAIEKAGYSPQKIKTELHRLKNYPGVTGKTSFDSNGDVVKPVGIKKLENERFIWLQYKY